MKQQKASSAAPGNMVSNNVNVIGDNIISDSFIRKQKQNLTIACGYNDLYLQDLKPNDMDMEVPIYTTLVNT